MADNALRKALVEAWRASGLTAPEFCQGKDITPGGLRQWAYRLRKTEAGDTEPSPRPVLRLVRLVRAPAVPKEPARSLSAPAPTPTPQQVLHSPDSSLILEVRGARIGIAPGFDPATLATVLQVLDQHTRQSRSEP
jgi:transposase